MGYILGNGVGLFEQSIKHGPSPFNRVVQLDSVSFNLVGNFCSLVWKDVKHEEHLSHDSFFDHVCTVHQDRTYSSESEHNFQCCSKYLNILT